MKRSIYVIKGHSKSEEELEIDKYYAEQYVVFFNSNAGGAYEPEEIFYFEDISVNSLYMSLSKI